MRLYFRFCHFVLSKSSTRALVAEMKGADSHCATKIEKEYSQLIAFWQTADCVPFPLRPRASYPHNHLLCYSLRLAAYVGHSCLAFALTLPVRGFPEDARVEEEGTSAKDVTTKHATSVRSGRDWPIELEGNAASSAWEATGLRTRGPWSVRGWREVIMKGRVVRGALFPVSGTTWRNPLDKHRRNRPTTRGNVFGFFPNRA